MHTVVIAIVFDLFLISSHLDSVVNLIEAGQKVLGTLECDILDGNVDFYKVVLVQL